MKNLILSALFGAFLAWLPGYARATTGDFSIVQGVTTASTTQISILEPKGTQYTVRLIEDAEFPFVFYPDTETRVSRPSSDWAIHKISFSDLQLGMTYLLEVMNPKGEIVESRKLKTLDIEHKSVTFALISCFKDKNDAESNNMWKDILAHKPEAVFFIGDAVYIDEATGWHKPKVNPDFIWKRHVEARQKVYIYHAYELVPIFATWDDHDYGENDSNRSFTYKTESAAIFQEFFAQDPVEHVWTAGPGLSHELLAFGQRFFFMDDRTYRAPKGLPATEQTHWGADQENWLFAELKKEELPTWILNGSQFFGGYHPFESYQGNHPASFEKWTARMRSEVKSPVALGSGDMHLAELMDIPASQFGYDTLEITSSGITHTSLVDAFWKVFPNPYQRVGKVKKNYSIVTSVAMGPRQMRIEAASFTNGNIPLYQGLGYRVDSSSMK